MNTSSYNTNGDIIHHINTSEKVIVIRARQHINLINVSHNTVERISVHFWHVKKNLLLKIVFAK